MTDAVASNDPLAGGKPSNFIRAIIDEDLAKGVHQTVRTRFPPEPNGYLHIGHAKSICLNFGLGRDYQGACHLRFDDTNPTKEEVEYVESIQEDVRWLGFDWGPHLYYASDYFQTMYDLAIDLIKEGKAYVCSLPEEEMRVYRGTLTEPGKDSPYRNRSIQENLELFEGMRAGRFKEGEHVLRGKGDMSHPNMKMRDPLLYRILHAHHHRTGDAWCIYPMYDYAHPLEDALEHITHSICTLEFENNRDIYDWVLDNTRVPSRPHQYEFARLNLNCTVMSKRKLLDLVEGNHVNGWDDPRLPTIAGMRRRGYTPEAIRDFCERIGVAKANSTVDFSMLEFCVRDDLNHKAPRVMAVLDPIRLVIDNYPDDQVESLDAPSFPHDIPAEGSRPVPFRKTLLIERDDFMENPPKKYYRLAPGQEVRLRYAYIVKCVSVERDAAGLVTTVHCTYDPDTLGKNPTDRKVQGTIHWVPAQEALPAEVRIYDRLFTVENPGAGDSDYLTQLNPDSLKVVQGFVEPSLASYPTGQAFQFERLGYFVSDAKDSQPHALVFNRTVGLRDSWAKLATDETPAAKPAAEPAPAKAEKAPAKSQPAKRDPALDALRDSLQQQYQISSGEAETLASNTQALAYFRETLEACPNPRLVAAWVNNELLRVAKEKPLAELPFGPAEFGALVALINQETLSGTAAKDVLAEMVAQGTHPQQIVESRGLAQINDPAALAVFVDQVLSQQADMVAKYKAGEAKWAGVLMGQVMKAAGGKGNPKLLKDLLNERLGA